MLGLKQILLVGLGGAIGAIARYKMGGFILHRTEVWNFPLSTLCVNLLGCLIIGVLAAVAEHHDLITTDARLFLFTGLLGGFTTFSAFAFEGFFLLRRSHVDLALLYAVVSVAGGLAAVWLGMKFIDLFWPASA